MTKPLALLMYQNLLPGSKLASRLRDLDYRVETQTELKTLPEQARALKPLVIIMEIQDQEVIDIIKEIRQNPETAHIPILAYCGLKRGPLPTQAREAGATLVASDKLILDQFSQMLEQVLLVE
jgi:CheY-like chemotaxis protein